VPGRWGKRMTGGLSACPVVSMVSSTETFPTHSWMQLGASIALHIAQGHSKQPSLRCRGTDLTNTGV